MQVSLYLHILRLSSIRMFALLCRFLIKHIYYSMVSNSTFVDLTYHKQVQTWRSLRSFYSESLINPIQYCFLEWYSLDVTLTKSWSASLRGRWLFLLYDFVAYLWCIVLFNLYHPVSSLQFHYEYEDDENRLQGKILDVICIKWLK